MTYGLSPGLFVENGPAIQAARALQARSARSVLAATLKPRPAANDDLCDGFPIAL